jgi:hypothetical protein
MHEQAARAFLRVADPIGISPNFPLSAARKLHSSFRDRGDELFTMNIKRKIRRAG